MQSGENRSNGFVYVLGAALVCVIAISLGYTSRERDQARQLEARNQALTTSLTAVQTELQTVQDRLNGPATPPPMPITHPALPAKPKARVASAKHIPAKAKEDPRWEQIQNRLSTQQDQIDSTREDLDKSRLELEGKLDSTHDELSGSIAKSHDELVALEKRGERNYFEFTLDKSKQFRRVGPVGLVLRKTNVKRKSYDLSMLVDDNQLQKKSVNLYEPVWINLSDLPQPVQLVVNRIDKDHIQGYVSAPKYKESELNVSTSAAKSLAAPVQQ